MITQSPKRDTVVNEYFIIPYHKCEKLAYRSRTDNTDSEDVTDDLDNRYHKCWKTNVGQSAIDGNT